jgi:hypothetical protein
MPDVKVMSKVTRLGGGILAETHGTYYLVGELKGPCDFEKHGFKKPEEGDPDRKPKFKALEVIGEVKTEEGIYLEMEAEGEALAELLFERFVILRNYSVSNRLWNVATCNAKDGKVDARWLEQMPDDVWEVVRESMLKCL